MLPRLPGPRSWSIRSRLLLLVLSVWLPAVVAFALLAHTTYLREETAVRAGMRDRAESLNSVVAGELDKRAVLARALAASVALRDGDIGRFHREAALAVQETGASVFLVDRERQLANTRMPAPRALARPQGAPFIEDGPPRVVFAGRTPVRQQPGLGVFMPEAGVHPPRYNVGVSLDPRVIQQVVAQHAAAMPGEGNLSVLDPQHLVIARSRDPDRWLGVEATGVLKQRLLNARPGFEATVTLDGMHSLSYVSAPNRYGWMVVVAMPLAALRQAAWQLTLQTTLASAVLLLIGLGLALYAARRISQPLGTLQEAALALGRNEVPPRAATGLDEADAVGAAMHEAGVRLEASGRELQERVAAAVRSTQQAQVRLLEAQKHEAIGRLTGGIAHDFNNLLQTITMGLHVLDRSVPAGRHSRALAGALSACTRAADLVRQMLTFGRSQPLQPQAVQVRDFLLKNQELTRKAVGERIRLTATIDPLVRAVHVDPTQLELALLNLVFNARDAMAQGGRIEVRARPALPEEAAGLEGGPFLCLQVQDDGPGIPPELQAKVFEPYFTTKAVGLGSGLGLAQVLAFARQSGGDARLASTPGEGTCVSLLLPACDEAPQEEGAEAAAAPVRPLRILMVEDDVLVASVVAPALEAEGHELTLCATADEALAFLQDGWSFDLLFTDIVMPGEMSGLDLAAWCRAQRPSLAVVVSTGYTAERVDPGHTLLRKPYGMRELLATLQAAAGPPA